MNICPLALKLNYLRSKHICLFIKISCCAYENCVRVNTQNITWKYLYHHYSSVFWFDCLRKYAESLKIELFLHSPSPRCSRTLVFMFLENTRNRKMWMPRPRCNNKKINLQILFIATWLFQDKISYHITIRKWKYISDFCFEIGKISSKTSQSKQPFFKIWRIFSQLENVRTALQRNMKMSERFKILWLLF